MSILTQLKQKFDTFLSNIFNQSDDYCLILISKLLEELDLELAATRDKSLEIVKIVPRTILTSKALLLLDADIITILIMIPIFIY